MKAFGLSLGIALACASPASADSRWIVQACAKGATDSQAALICEAFVTGLQSGLHQMVMRRAVDRREFPKLSLRWCDYGRVWDEAERRAKVMDSRGYREQDTLIVHPMNDSLIPSAPHRLGAEVVALACFPQARLPHSD